MDVSLESLLNLYTFSTGRRLFALARVMKAAEGLQLTDLAAHCAAALKHDRHTRALETKWAAPPAPAGKAQRIDVKLDRALIALRDTAQAHAGSGDDDDEAAQQARELLTAIFPEGAQAVTQLACVEELSAVEGILTTLKGKKFAPVVAELGLGRFVKQIGKLVPEYRAALEAPEEKGVDFGAVRAARAQGQGHLLEAVAMIVGKYPRSTPEHVANRTALLGPILQQNEAIRAYLRSRRPVQDVNPETGEEDAAAPGAEAAAGGAAEKAPG